MSGGSEPTWGAGADAGPAPGPDGADHDPAAGHPADGMGPAVGAPEAGNGAASGGADSAGIDDDGVDGPADDGAISVEDLVRDLERVTSERDQYLDTSRRIQAEFENYRKQVAKRDVETRERAAESLVAQLLPVLDACDGALASGASDVEPVRTALVDALTRQGLARIDGAEEPFDPGRHDAVLHEPGDDAEQVVAEIMRAGYSWNGRVVRPAMVRVRGG